MNKKGGTITIIIIMVIAAIITFVMIQSVNNSKIPDLTFQEGSSTDYVYTIEQGKISGWHKLYLKDDHKTLYCFDDPKILSALSLAKEENIKVTVYYKEYLFRGMLCGSPSNIDTVVITDVELKEG